MRESPIFAQAGNGLDEAVDVAQTDGRREIAQAVLAPFAGHGHRDESEAKQQAENGPNAREGGQGGAGPTQFRFASKPRAITWA